MFLLSCLFKQLKQTELLVCKTAAEPKPAFTAGAADPPRFSLTLNNIRIWHSNEKQASILY